MLCKSYRKVNWCWQSSHGMMSLLDQTLLLYFEILQVFLFRPFIFDECFCFVDAKNKNLNKAKLCQVPGRPRRRLDSFARQHLKAFVPTLSSFKINYGCDLSVPKVFFSSVPKLWSKSKMWKCKTWFSI